MTSLLDVLFIMLFAALVQAAQMVESAKDAPAARPRPAPGDAASEPPAPVKPSPADSRPPVHAPPPAPVVTLPAPASPGAVPSADLPTLRAEAARTLVARSARAGVVRIRISATGHILRLKADMAGLSRDQAVDIPLLERVPDPDVGLSYLGARVGDLSLCSSVRRALGLRDLGGALVVIETALPLRGLPVALVEGLNADQLRCYEEEKGLAVLVEGAADPVRMERQP
ncbi:MAG: hypothetical protein CVU65_15415 [Deltaproteobacteria bacterium HGW-Deltaproteobacteria-22]|nr:MAG: hypothetical protein CVU65_15415 [Deltaproteobacteria bacterium HGW-Deltaproteobacteria-22]